MNLFVNQVCDLVVYRREVYTVVGTSLDITYMAAYRKLISYLSIKDQNMVDDTLKQYTITFEPNKLPFVDCQLLPYFQQLNDKIFDKPQRLKLGTYDYKIPLTQAFCKQEIINFADFVLPQTINNLKNLISMIEEQGLDYDRQIGVCGKHAEIISQGIEKHLGLRSVLQRSPMQTKTLRYTPAFSYFGVEL